MANKTELIQKMNEMAIELSEQFPADAARKDGKTYRQLIAEKLAEHTDNMELKFTRPEFVFNQFCNDLDTTRRVGTRKGIIS